MTSNTKRQVSVENINALAELERLSWDFEPVGNDEVKLRCPKHDDKTASASLNTSKNLWHCHVASCNAKGDFVTFFAYALNCTRKAALIELSKRYDIGVQKVVSQERVEAWHTRIFDAGPLLQALRDRAVDDAMLREARIGFDGQRITIPVFDAHGSCVNVRRYLPGAPGADKMKNLRGFGSVALYNVRAVETANAVLVCGGEMKALVAQHQLGKGVACVAATAGEGKWLDEWNRLLVGKQVYVCMDVDEAGERAARKVAKNIAAVIDDVRIVKLPLDKERFPKGDLNDYFALGFTGDDLLKLMHDASAFVPVDDTEVEEPTAKGTKQVSLRDAVRRDNVGYDLSFKCVASAADTTPYVLPRAVRIRCNRDQNFCRACPVNQADTDNPTLEVPRLAEGILDLMRTTKRGKRQAIIEALRMPPCNACRVDIVSHYTAHEVRLSKQLELSSDEGGGNIMQPAVFIEADYELNTPYVCKGRLYPEPSSQQAVLLIDTLQESSDSLETFQPSNGQLEPLRQFQPEAWTLDAVRAKLEVLYDEMERGVTRIFGRREMHELVDLTFHSVLLLRDGRRMQNGWLNTLIMGDSAQGKSEVTTMLMSYYDLGERVECKNATVAGLLGGLQQIGTRWFVSWGVIPTHDRRLVVLEEVKGAPPDVLQKLTDMRSSGIAEIPKIERQRAHARTRLVWVSNPRGSRQVATYNFGIEAIEELVGSLEDVRRFDAACIVASGEVDYDSMELPFLEDTFFNPEMSKRLVLWAWTRPPVDITEMRKYVRMRAGELCRKFDEGIPLVDKGTMPLKLARLAVAVAARTFSCDEDGNLALRECHVDYAQELLMRCYTTDAFGYEGFTATRRALHEVKRPDLVKRTIADTRFPVDFAEGLLHTDRITLTDFMDWCAVDRDAAQSLLSVFVRCHALRRHQRNYVKSPDFIKLLKTWTFAERVEDEF